MISCYQSGIFSWSLGIHIVREKAKCINPCCITFSHWQSSKFRWKGCNGTGGVVVVVDWFGIFFLLRAYELTARILFVLGVWDRFIRSCDLVGYSCMLWKGHCSTKSDLADFIQYRAVWVEAAPGSRRTCLTFVEPRYQSAIHLTILLSFLIPTLKSCLIYLGDLRLDYLPKTQHCWA